MNLRSNAINEGYWNEGAILCTSGSRRYFAVGDTEADPGGQESDSKDSDGYTGIRVHFMTRCC